MRGGSHCKHWLCRACRIRGWLTRNARLRLPAASSTVMWLLAFERRRCRRRRRSRHSSSRTASSSPASAPTKPPRTRPRSAWGLPAWRQRQASHDTTSEPFMLVLRGAHSVKWDRAGARTESMTRPLCTFSEHNCSKPCKLYLYASGFVLERETWRCQLGRRCRFAG